MNMLINFDLHASRACLLETEAHSFCCDFHGLHMIIQHILDFQRMDSFDDAYQDALQTDNMLSGASNPVILSVVTGSVFCFFSQGCFSRGKKCFLCGETIHFVDKCPKSCKYISLVVIDAPEVEAAIDIHVTRVVELLPPVGDVC